MRGVAVLGWQLASWRQGPLLYRPLASRSFRLQMLPFKLPDASFSSIPHCAPAQRDRTRAERDEQQCSPNTPMSKTCPTCLATFADSHAFCPTDGTTLRASELASGMVGTVIADRYMILELLGEGGMGKVYLAQHVRLPRQAAIKFLHPHMVQDPAAMARFSREANNASRIDHERVAHVFDFGETTDGMVYLAMEYITGRSLKQVLAENSPLPLPRVSALIAQIADGLDAAHRLGIVHRDLKPDNIVVAKDEDGSDSCKIVDFGIAKAIGSGEKSLTQTGFVIGTPEYMSPEQLLGEEIDHRSDVYALALMAYQCVTGETAFDSTTPDRGMMARLTNQPRKIAELRPSHPWPRDLQAVLDLGLDRQRDKRYGSAGAFAAAFASAITSPVGAVVSPARATPKQAAKGKVADESAAPHMASSGPPVRSIPTPPARPSPVARPVAQRPPAVTPAAANAPTPVSRPATRPRRTVRLPRIPLVRWLTTIAVLWFVWLVVSEGSVRRAVRRATATVRALPSRAVRLVSSTRSASDAVVSGAANAGTRAATTLNESAADSAASLTTVDSSVSLAPVSGLVGGARNALDTLGRARASSGSDDGVRRTALVNAESLLRLSATAGDSVTAFLRIAKAHRALEQNRAACASLASARRLGGADAVRALESQFECAP